MEMPMQDVSRAESTIEIIQNCEDDLSRPASLDLTSNNAIFVQGAYKKYGDQVALNDFNMAVPEGCIFGLLGSSGCGKTTLINCLIGMSEIDFGTINMKYSKFSDIGLMPQDTALIPSLTIAETLNYFGKMFGMSNKKILDRRTELVRLLDLPSVNTRTDNLSGGQKRRVSFAVALLHDPKILLLDEPTVGLDPLLSKSIWTHLISIVKEKHKTVFITTHYIEEARQAHFVGLMRQGKLIETGPPYQLMEKHDSSTLEETFLLLCKKEDKLETNWPATSSVEPPVQVTFNKNDKFSFSRFRAQCYKNYLFFTREIVFLVIVFGIPLFDSILLHWALGRDPDSITIAIVNNDIENCYFNGCYNNCSWQEISCCYTKRLQDSVKNFHLVYKDDFKEARELVVKNEAWALIYFPRNFSNSLSKRSFKYFNPILADDILQSSEIKIYYDAADKIIEMFLKRKLTKTYFDFFENFYISCGWESRAADIPVKFENPVYGSNDPVFTHYQTAPFIMNSAFFLPMMLTPLILLTEKISGFLQRCISSGLTIIELLAALIVTQMITLVLQIAVFFIFLYGIYDHPFLCDIWLPFSICIYEGFSGIIFGILLSFVSTTYTTAALGGNGMFFILVFTNGSLWPLEAVHPVLKKFFWWSPLALASDALRSITVRGWTFLNPKVYYGFISISIWTILYIILIKLIGLKNGMMVNKK